MIARYHRRFAASRQSRGVIAFPWYGGKVKFLHWLMPLLPPTPQYCEPFAGSASVLLNRPLSNVETLNDIDSEVVNFFRILRDHPSEIERLLRRTPYSREEFNVAGVRASVDVERARRFFVRIRQSWGSRGTSWSYCVRGKAQGVNTWNRCLPALEAVAARLRKVQLENSPAVDVIRRFDHRDTLFYCDPPYPHQSRVATSAYRFELNDDDHRALADALRAIKGKAAISGYRCALMDRLYRGWRRVDCPFTTLSVKRGRSLRESLWLNW
jgi:DNA adenine methylase